MDLSNFEIFYEELVRMENERDLPFTDEHIESAVSALEKLKECDIQTDNKDNSRFHCAIIKYYFLLSRYLKSNEQSKHHQNVVRKALATLFVIVNTFKIQNVLIGYVQSFTDKMVLTYPSIPFLKEFLRAYLQLLYTVTRNTLQKLANKQKSVRQLYDIVKKTDDTEIQFIIVEIFIKLFSFNEMKSYLHGIFPEMKIISNMEITDRDVIQQNANMVVNKLNAPEAAGDSLDIIEITDDEEVSLPEVRPPPKEKISENLTISKWSSEENTTPEARPPSNKKVSENIITTSRCSPSFESALLNPEENPVSPPRNIPNEIPDVLNSSVEFGAFTERQTSTVFNKSASQISFTESVLEKSLNSNKRTGKKRIKASTVKHNGQMKQKNGVKLSTMKQNKPSIGAPIGRELSASGSEISNENNNNIIMDEMGKNKPQIGVLIGQELSISGSDESNENNNIIMDEMGKNKPSNGVPIEQELSISESGKSNENNNIDRVNLNNGLSDTILKHDFANNLLSSSKVEHWLQTFPENLPTNSDMEIENDNVVPKLNQEIPNNGDVEDSSHLNKFNLNAKPIKSVEQMLAELMASSSQGEKSKENDYQTKVAEKTNGHVDSDNDKTLSHLSEILDSQKVRDVEDKLEEVNVDKSVNSEKRKMKSNSNFNYLNEESKINGSKPLESVTDSDNDVPLATLAIKLRKEKKSKTIKNKKRGPSSIENIEANFVDPLGKSNSLIDMDGEERAAKSCSEIPSNLDANENEVPENYYRTKSFINRDIFPEDSTSGKNKRTANKMFDEYFGEPVETSNNAVDVDQYSLSSEEKAKSSSEVQSNLDENENAVPEKYQTKSYINKDVFPEDSTSGKNKGKENKMFGEYSSIKTKRTLYNPGNLSYLNATITNEYLNSKEVIDLVQPKRRKTTYQTKKKPRNKKPSNKTLKRNLLHKIDTSKAGKSPSNISFDKIFNNFKENLSHVKKESHDKKRGKSRGLKRKSSESSGPLEPFGVVLSNLSKKSSTGDNTTKRSKEETNPTSVIENGHTPNQEVLSRRSTGSHINIASLIESAHTPNQEVISRRSTGSHINIISNILIRPPDSHNGDCSYCKEATKTVNTCYLNFIKMVQHSNPQLLDKNGFNEVNAILNNIFK